MKKLSKLIQSGKATDYHYDLLQEDKEQLKKLKRVHQAEVNMSYFMLEYFSEAKNPGNDGNLIPQKEYEIEDMPTFHRELGAILDSVSNHNKTAKVCWSASRGHAKSAYLSNAHPTREIVFRKRKLILIISETASGSQKFLRWIAGQLKYNKKLRDDFGDLLNPNQKANELDSKEQFLTSSGTMLATSSLGKQIRGYRNGEARPDLVILDDLESRASNNTPELRNSAKLWLTSDLEPAVDIEKASICFMGTVCHSDSLLSYVLNNRKDYLRNQFPAILNHPKRVDLWNEYERIFKEYEPSEEELEAYAKATTKMPTPNEQAALRFFEENKEEMLLGQDPLRNGGKIEVLWPSRFPIEKLMLIKPSVGSQSWATEYMNIAISDEDRTFKPETYRRHDIQHFSHQEYELFGAVDWAMGNSAKSDRSVYLILAKHKVTKKLYLVDYYANRIKPNAFMDVIVEMTMKYQPSFIGVETNMAQEYLKSELQARLQFAGYPAYTRVKGIHQKQRKELRIELLQPLLEKGDLVLNNFCSLLEEEMNTFPVGKNDDSIDCLSLCVKISSYSKATVRPKPSWL